MKKVYAVVVLVLCIPLVSCCGSNEEMAEPPPAGSIETETATTSDITVGDVPGLFYYGESDGDEYARIRLLGREPRNGSQVVTFVYTGPYFSVTGTEEILKELNPRLSCDGREPSDFVNREIVTEVGFHETVGEIFEVIFPDGKGDCTLIVNTVGGPDTIELGDASKTYRYAEKVKPGIKVNLRSGPSIDRAIIRVLESGEFVYPTGELGMLGIVERSDGTYLPPFQKVTTPLGEAGWVTRDYEVFEFAGYMEAPAE